MLRVDDEGAVLYRDSALAPEEAVEASVEESSVATSMAAQDVFALHSNPGSTNVVYLDFDGHVISGTAWNGSGGPLYARPYDTDGDASSFSQSEFDAIAEIWHRIAEDYAPFDVDVTTEEPASFGATTGRILITRDDDELGAPMPYAGAGGVAYINVWGRTGTYDYPYYSPALVYYDNLGNGQPRYVAEASSHELGHNLALSHDGTSTTTYYGGHNAGPSGGYIDWAPIMGNSYGSDVSQWSQGGYTDANNQQDDMDEIAARLYYRFDDHADAEDQATPLLVDGAGNVVSTNPELDPFNVNTENKGVIEDRTDVDFFVLSLGSGVVDLTVRPAWDAYYHEASRGANLDIHAALYDALGNQVAADDPATDTHATVVASVSAGTYYLAVTGAGAGSAQSSYDDYASAGQYFINGTVPVGESNDPPKAVNDTGALLEDGSIILDVLSNDTDPDSDPLAIVAVTQPTHGGAVANGSLITYTPAANYNGSDAFTYTISDGFSTVGASVAVQINAVNDMPVAGNDAATTPSGSAMTVHVMANDSDVDGDTLAIVGTTQPANGSVGVSGAAVTYTPQPGFVGTDSFQYTVADGVGGNATASVTVTVQDLAVVPDAPATLTVTDTGVGTAAVSWSASAGADGYEVRRESRHKRRSSWNGTTTVGTTGAGMTTLDDASSAGTYRYQVRAFNSAGASPWTAWVTVTVTDSSGGGGGGKGNRNKAPKS